jgi:hypothetical protein
MSTCPLDEGCNLDNCKFCAQKMDCILLAILQKVESIERRMEKVASQTV